MKMMKWSIVLLSMVLTLGSLSVYADEEEQPTASADIGVFTKYIWRGYELSDDSMVIQPSLTIGYKGFSINAWGNLDTEFDDGDPTTDDDSDLSETDLTLSYERSFGPMAVGVGFIYYSLNGPDTDEVYLSVGADIPLAPTLTVYKDIAEFNGWYVNLGVSHSFELPWKISLDLSGSMGYYYSTDDTFVEINERLIATTNKYKALHDGVLSAGLTIPLGRYLSLVPSVSYIFPLSDDADNLLTSTSFSNDSDHLYGGIILSLAF